MADSNITFAWQDAARLRRLPWFWDDKCQADCLKEIDELYIMGEHDPTLMGISTGKQQRVERKGNLNEEERNEELRIERFREQAQR
jgi:hypothetical protein